MSLASVHSLPVAPMDGHQHCCASLVTCWHRQQGARHQNHIPPMCTLRMRATVVRSWCLGQVRAMRDADTGRVLSVTRATKITEMEDRFERPTYGAAIRCSTTELSHPRRLTLATWLQVLVYIVI